MGLKYKGDTSLNFLLIALLCLSALLFFHKTNQQNIIRYAPGVLVSETPKQTSLDVNTTWKVGKDTIKPIASFDIRARVLHAKAYRSDREAHLSPIDLALGWGSMSDQAVLDQLTITQSNRWYHWRYDNQPPIPIEQIVSQSGNMHMLPANAAVLNLLETVKPGDIVKIKGYLVNVEGPKGFNWRSSTSRKDQNAGSCEVVWVERIEIENPTGVRHNK